MLEYLYDKNTNKKIKELITYINSLNIKGKKEIIDYLTLALKDRYRLYCDIDVFKNIINITLPYLKNNKFIYFNSLAKKLYKTNLPLEPTEIDLKNFYNFYSVLVEFNFIDLLVTDDVIEDCNSIFYSFQNKNLVINLFKEILKKKKINEKMDKTMPGQIVVNLVKCINDLKIYIYESKMYYNDEYSYLSVIINLLNNYQFSDKISDNKNYLKIEEQNKELINNQLKFDKKLSGIYDVDEEKIQELEKKIKTLESMLLESDKKVKNLNQKCDELNTNGIINFEKNTSLFNELFNSQEAILITKLKTINNEFKVAIDDRNWLTNDVINIFGSTYIANTTYREQNFISYIFNNNLLEKWKELLNINPNLNFNTDYIWFNDETINILGLEYLAHTSWYAQAQIARFSVEELNLLKEILNLNPNFDFHDTFKFSLNYKYIINNNVFKTLGKEYVAYASNDEKFLIYSFHQDEYDNLLKLKNILNINPNFLINISDYEDISWVKFDSLINFIQNSNEQDIIEFLSNEDYIHKILGSNDFIEYFCFLSHNSKLKWLSNYTDSYGYDLNSLKKLEKLENNKFLSKIFIRNKKNY